MKLTKTECACEECQRGCTHTPGWFRPGEAEKTAAFLGLSLEDFFKQSLMVNWWVEDPDDVFVLAPAIVGHMAGNEYPASPNGTCVFFKHGRCEIHAVKPFECSHGNPHDSPTGARKKEMVAQRERTVALWKKRQKQIVTLLGREPQSEEMSPFGWFF